MERRYALSLWHMSPFSVTIAGQVYDVQPYASQYSISFHITAGESTIIFELDEEDSLRARSTGEAPKAELIAQLAEEITKHFNR